MSETASTTRKARAGGPVRRTAVSVAAWFWTNALVIAFGAWLVGEVFRDRFHLSALCFIVPSVFPAAALLLAAPLAYLCGCRRVATAAVILWLFPTFWLLFVENRWFRPRPQGDPAAALRLVHWNVKGAQQGWEGIIAQLKAREADVYVLTDVYNVHDAERVAAGIGPGLRALHIRQIAVIAREPVRLIRPDERLPNRAYLFQWDSRHGPITLLPVDLPSYPFYSRSPWLRKVYERVAFLRPDLVVGDFNARRRARWLGTPPKGYRHAYFAAGAGWGYTWPDGFALWDIDQCLFGPRVRPIRYDLVSTGVSEHRMQVFDFSLAP